MLLWQRPQQGQVYGHNADLTPELLSKGVLGHHLLRVSTDEVPCNLPEAFWELQNDIVHLFKANTERVL